MATIKKAQGGAKTTKKPKTASQRIGDITLRDVKNAGEDALNISTLGGYGKIKKALGGEYKYKKLGEKKNGGKVTKAKNGKSFPDLNKDGKVTKADILKGRGVIAKKGATIKKAQSGIMAKASKAISGAADKAGKWIKAHQTGGAETDRQRRMTGKNGKSMKKCKYGCN